MSSSFAKRVLSRALLSSLFTIIAVVGVIAAVRADSSAAVVHHALSAVLWGMFAVLVIIRPVPVKRGGSKTGVAAALGAQAVTIMLGVVAGDSTFSGAALFVADILLAGGLLFAIASLAFLGRCFGILPDVRGLVTRGPYQHRPPSALPGRADRAARHRAGRRPLGAGPSCCGWSASACSWCAPAMRSDRCGPSSPSTASTQIAPSA